MDSCGVFKCTDISEHQDSVILTVIHFKADNSSLHITEPSLASDGNITVITDCLFPNSVSVKWSTVKDGEVIADIESSTYSVEHCSTSCSGSPAVKIQTFIVHNETKGKSITVSYNLVIQHMDVKEPIIWTSEQRYKIIDTDEQTPSETKLSAGAIAGIVIGVIALLALLGGAAIFIWFKRR
ncbi:uncharacterized protein LOC128233759 [Mya arenaria]|nr:uncharacterized protein LOC128233759 [Mya arenaria]